MIFDALSELASDRRPRKANLRKWDKKGGEKNAERQKAGRPTTKAEAERIWFDARIKTVEEAAARAGWHWRTMYRAFGPRGVSVGRPHKVVEEEAKAKPKRKARRK